VDQFLNFATSHHIYGNELIKLPLSVIVGCIIGLEREIRGKSAGFRTLALICFGATVFTICSYLLGVQDNRDRLAANIITGIGFIGAGVIFRNNSSVSGITTAASIWIAAALGMLIGIGEYFLAGMSLIFSLLILYTLDFIQFWIDDNFQHRNYKVIFRKDCSLSAVKAQVKFHRLKITRAKVLRTDLQMILECEITGKSNHLDLFNEWLIEDPSIFSVEW